MSSFRYPEAEADLVGLKLHSDFLRCHRTYPNKVDPTYLTNQAAAANWFMDWFLSPNHPTPFDEMLRRQHALAALGTQGGQTYKIYFGNNGVLLPKLQDGIIHYASSCQAYWRVTYAGKLREQLEREQLDHPTTDRFKLSKADFNMLKLCGFCVDALDMIWVHRSGAVPAQGRATEYSISVGIESVLLPLKVTKHGLFSRNAPVGEQRAGLMRSMNDAICKLRATWPSTSQNLLNKQLWAYYHTAINCMPFGNINNSILMAQVNAIRRLAGFGGLLHGQLDTVALAAPQKTFLDFAVRTEESKPSSRA